MCLYIPYYTSLLLLLLFSTVDLPVYNMYYYIIALICTQHMHYPYVSGLTVTDISTRSTLDSHLWRLETLLTAWNVVDGFTYSKVSLCTKGIHRANVVKTSVTVCTCISMKCYDKPGVHIYLIDYWSISKELRLAGNPPKPVFHRHPQKYF